MQHQGHQSTDTIYRIVGNRGGVSYIYIHVLYTFTLERSFTQASMYTHSHAERNLFEILLNQPGIRLYLPFSDWFGTQTDTSVCVPKKKYLMHIQELGYPKMKRKCRLIKTIQYLSLVTLVVFSYIYTRVYLYTFT